MHLMGATARWMRFSDPLPNLTRPGVGLRWGCRYLKMQFDKYGNTEDALAAYNGGAPRRLNGVLEPKLQRYVDRVMGFYDDLTEKPD